MTSCGGDYSVMAKLVRSGQILDMAGPGIAFSTASEAPGIGALPFLLD
jgi:hypothetical protein